MSQPRPLVVSELNPPLNVELVTDERGLANLSSFLEANDSYGLDIETNVVEGFYWRRVRTIQIGNRDEQFVVDLLPFAGSPELLHSVQGDYGARLAGSGLQVVIDLLRPHLEDHSREAIGYNLAFESVALRWCFGIRAHGYFDLYYAHKLLNAGRVNAGLLSSYSLEDMVRDKLGLQLNKEYQTSFTLDGELSQGQVEYGALDVRLPFALRAHYAGLLAKHGLERVAQIEFDAISAFAEMHINGLCIDTEKWTARVHRDEARLRKVIERMDRVFIPVVGHKEHTQEELDTMAAIEEQWRSAPSKTADEKKQRTRYRLEYMEYKKRETKRRNLTKDCEGEALLNYRAGEQVKAGLIAAKLASPKDLPDTSDETLAKLSKIREIKADKIFDEDPELEKVSVIDLLRLHRTITQYIKMYGLSWAKRQDEEFVDYLGKKRRGYIDPDTGRIHARFNQIGTDTGRTSSTGPNVSNLPQDALLRSCFIAPPGYKSIGIDLSGAELRILAELSQDPVWLEAFRNDWDLHSIVAELTFDEWKDMAEEGCEYYSSKQKCKCKRHKELRDQRAKTVNFGIAYGKTEFGFASDMGISREEAAIVLKKWRKANPVAAAYLDKTGQDAVTRMETRSIAGRARWWNRPTFEKSKAALEKDGKNPTTDQARNHMLRVYRAIEREGRNAPIQSSNADIIKRSMYLIWRDGQEYGLLQWNSIYDENDLWALAEKAEEAAKFAGDCMKKAGAEFVKSIEMTHGEPTIGDYWQK